MTLVLIDVERPEPGYVLVGGQPNRHDREVRSRCFACWGWFLHVPGDKYCPSCRWSGHVAPWHASE